MWLCFYIGHLFSDYIVDLVEFIVLGFSAFLGEVIDIVRLLYIDDFSTGNKHRAIIFLRDDKVFDLFEFCDGVVGFDAVLLVDVNLDILGIIAAFSIAFWGINLACPLLCFYCLLKALFHLN